MVEMTRDGFTFLGMRFSGAETAQFGAKKQSDPGKTPGKISNKALWSDPR